jgi:hypothetical protein
MLVDRPLVLIADADAELAAQLNEGVRHLHAIGWRVSPKLLQLAEDVNRAVNRLAAVVTAEPAEPSSWMSDVAAASAVGVSVRQLRNRGLTFRREGGRRFYDAGAVEKLVGSGNRPVTETSSGRRPLRTV